MDERIYLDDNYRRVGSVERSEVGDFYGEMPAAVRDEIEFIEGDDEDEDLVDEI